MLSKKAKTLESHQANKCTRGIVALPLMLLISAVVLEMTAAASIVAFYILQGSAGARNAAEALVAARSGVSDAATQLVRNRSFSSAYTITIDAQRTAKITVCNNGRKTTGCSLLGGCDYTNPSDAGKVEVTSMGTVKNKNSCVRAIYVIDADTGEIKSESSREIEG